MFLKLIFRTCIYCVSAPPSSTPMFFIISHEYEWSSHDPHEYQTHPLSFLPLSWSSSSQLRRAGAAPLPTMLSETRCPRRPHRPHRPNRPRCPHYPRRSCSSRGGVAAGGWQIYFYAEAVFLHRPEVLLSRRFLWFLLYMVGKTFEIVFRLKLLVDSFWFYWPVCLLVWFYGQNSAKLTSFDGIQMVMGD